MVGFPQTTMAAMTSNFVIPCGISTTGTVVPASTSFPFPVSTSGYQAPFTRELDYLGGSNAIYIGVAPSGSSLAASVWQIQFLTYDGNNNITSITWASIGSTTNIWNNRAALTYS